MKKYTQIKKGNDTKKQNIKAMKKVLAFIHAFFYT